MAKPTGPTNPVTRTLIKKLESASKENDAAIWAAIAARIGRATRRRAEVNVGTLGRICEKNESIAVPGKVLAAGSIEKPIKVAAHSISAAAKTKIEKAGGKVMSIEELVDANPKGKAVRVIA